MTNSKALELLGPLASFESLGRELVAAIQNGSGCGLAMPQFLVDLNVRAHERDADPNAVGSLCALDPQCALKPLPCPHHVDAPAHTPEENFEHFCAYSNVPPDPWLRYAYLQGAGVGLLKPEVPFVASAPGAIPNSNKLADALALLDEYERQTCALPVQHEIPERGYCTYNWRMACIRDLRALLAEHDAQPAPGEWQPIETAPKDGTRVLLSWDGTRVGYYLDNSASSRPWEGWKVTSLEPWPKGRPIAWMPMPAPAPAAPQPAPAPVQPPTVCIDFPQVGSAGPFPVIGGRVSLPDATMADLATAARCGYAPAPVQVDMPFLCGGARFKLAAGKNGAEFCAFPAELAGQWVALVDATDNRHMKAAHPPAPAADGVELSDHAIAQAAHNCGFDIEFGDADEIEAPRWITEDGGDGFADLRKFAVAIAALRQPVPDAVRLCAKPLSWHDDPANNEWNDRQLGYHITFDPEEDLDERYIAVCGEGEPEVFARLDDAKAWCQRDADDWVRKIGQTLAASAEGKTWRCEQCGELSNDMDPAWRWTGDRWQHHHEAVGHVDARAFGAEGKAVDLEQFRGAVSLLHLTCRRRLRDVRKGVFPAHYLPIFEQDLARASALLDLIDSQQEARGNGE